MNTMKTQSAAQLARNEVLRAFAAKRRNLKSAGISTSGMKWDEISQKHTALTQG
jgi:hypothetical protein